MANAGIVTTGQFSQLLTRDFHKIYMQTRMRYSPEWSQIANSKTWDEHQYKAGQASGLTQLQEFGEGEPIPVDSPVQGNEKEITFTKKGMSVVITQEMVDDDLKEYINKLPKELGKAADYTMEVDFWDLFNSGFDSDERVGLDSLELFSDAHTLINSSDTASNEGTSASLSRTSLQAGLTSFHNVVDENGIPVVYKPRFLIVDPDNLWKARELIQSEYKPESADNDINAVKEEGLQIFVCHYLTSTAPWFLVASKEDHDLQHIVRKPMRFRDWDDPAAEAKLYGTSGRWLDTFFDWRGTYGNLGV